MKKNSRPQVKKEDPEGFNPRIYRAIGCCFAVLSLINLAVVIFAFNRSGYGLYHAEDAVTHIAKIEQCLQNSNESILNIVVHKNNIKIIKSEAANINEEYFLLNEEAQAFRSIDLSNIDKTITKDFESAMAKVNVYYSALTDYTKMFQDYDESSMTDSDKLTYFMNMIESKYENDIEPLKTEATLAMSNVVEHQNQSTYAFYVKIAQEFLLVIGFMLFTMSVGLSAIRFMKNNARKDAAEIQQKKQDVIETAQEAAQFRKKAVAIAYTNVLTGFKNRYAMEDDIKKRLQTEDFTVAVFTFDNFHDLNQSYGRSFGDMYLAEIADIIKKKYSEIFDIYHTNIDEFSFVVKKYANQEKANAAIKQIAETLSAPVEVSKMQIQLNISGCVYRYHASERLDIDSLFVKIDRTIKETKNQQMHGIFEINSI